MARELCDLRKWQPTTVFSYAKEGIISVPTSKGCMKGIYLYKEPRKIPVSVYSLNHHLSMDYQTWIKFCFQNVNDEPI